MIHLIIFQVIRIPVILIIVFPYNLLDRYLLGLSNATNKQKNN